MQLRNNRPQTHAWAHRYLNFPSEKLFSLMKLFIKAKG